MNMVSDALIKCLDGSLLNKAIKYHEDRYKKLEENVNKDNF